jgi:two-component sensor histidine kinase
MEKTTTSPCPDNKSRQITLFIRFIVEHQLRRSLEINTSGGTAYTIRFPVPHVLEGHSNE